MSSGREIYNIRDSGWTAPKWNWGSAVGTGHDCALVCRQKFATRKSRADLVNNLRDPNSKGIHFEEVKLVLALAWQKARWDGSDGGEQGYAEVLNEMAKAQRYEIGSDEDRSRLLIQDMSQRYHLLDPTNEAQLEMQSVSSEDDHVIARQKCAGLVLEAMGFIEKGL